MAHFVPRHVRHLDRLVRRQLAELRGRPEMIRALWAGSGLSYFEKGVAT
jgi:hypothetical protein